MDIAKTLAKEFNLNQNHSQNIINLLAEGCTVPFIARYRKELTGSCDDQVLREFSDRLTYLTNLNKRKDEVVKILTEQGNLTEELSLKISNALTQTEVEDIYRPFKPKRKTRASMAIAKGLAPLAEEILKGENPNILDFAKSFVTEEVLTIEDAINGAKDIIAEKVSDSADVRKMLREIFFREAEIKTTISENENSKTYEMYADFSEAIKKIPSHRILAINRGEGENCLKVKIVLESTIATDAIKNIYINKKLTTEKLIEESILDSYDRLLFPSIEREIRTLLTDKASEQAIKMFEVNLKPLLMQPPLKNKVILGLDPAYRTGCKIAVIDSNSNVLATTVVYPTPPQSKVEEAEDKLVSLIKKHKVDVISIGNGTASKESEIFVANMIKNNNLNISYAIVNEAGASVYSASKLGAEEFPEFDVALRSAVSIARRLQDPLAELIKIDVKSIGIGQYQHDMPQKRLSEVLGGVVEDCVNSVGVDLNTASPSLLSFVSGLNAGIAKNIVEFRAESGAFKSRTELKKVPKLGDKAFTQSAGFLRIIEGKNILDNTAVHPESYESAKKLLKMFSLTEESIKNDELAALPLLVKLKGEEKVAAECGIGVPTLNDILSEIIKPGRDIRDSLPQVELRSDIMDLKDLKPEMILTGTVRNVIDFGVFVDIGVHQDGLVHISEISNKFIRHPSEVLKVGEVVKVKVISVDVDKKRIALSIKQA